MSKVSWNEEILILDLSLQLHTSCENLKFLLLVDMSQSLENPRPRLTMLKFLTQHVKAKSFKDFDNSSRERTKSVFHWQQKKDASCYSDKNTIVGFGSWHSWRAPFYKLVEMDKFQSNEEMSPWGRSHSAGPSLLWWRRRSVGNIFIPAFLVVLGLGQPGHFQFKTCSHWGCAFSCWSCCHPHWAGAGR